MVEIVVGIKLIRSGFYGGDKDEIYFIFVSILKSKKKLILNCWTITKNNVEMTWLLMWLNVSVATLNATL